MENMNKEELIEFFLYKLNKNNVLSTIYTEDEIRGKLNSIIKDVEYIKDIKKKEATWNFISNTITINSAIPYEHFKGHAIIHELLHVLTTSKSERWKITKVGVLFINNEKNELFGLGLTEGITDLLAEEISETNSPGYLKEKEFFKILSTIIDRDDIINKFCKDYDEKEFSSYAPMTIFDKEAKTKYGEIFGSEVNTAIVKAISLLDNQTIIHSMNDINNDQTLTEIYDNLESEMYETLAQIIVNVIDKKENLEEKIDILNKLSQSNSEKIAYRLSDKISEIYNEILFDENMSIDRKISIIKELSKHKNFNVGIEPQCQYQIAELVFSNFSNIDFKEKVKLISSLGVENIYAVNSKIIEELENSNIVHKSSFSKLGMISKIYYSSKLDEFINNIESAEYREIGSYYEILLNNKNYGYVDKSGRTVLARNIGRTTDENGNTKYFNYGFEKEQLNKIENIEKQLEDINAISGDKDSYDSFTLLGDSIVIMNYNFDNETIEKKECTKAYSIEVDGSLKPLEYGEKRRLTDDKPKLEIEIKDMTKGVRTSQIMDAVNDIQCIIAQEKSNKDQLPKGDIENV